MTAAVLTVAEAPDPAEFARLHGLMCEIGADHGCTPEELACAGHRDVIGMASLEVILVIARYLESKGRDMADFAPEWVDHLDSPAGMIAVMRQIDGL